MNEIAEPVKFVRNLDMSEARAIERRLVELEPYEAEARALRRRLVNIKRRLGVESNTALVQRSIIELLWKEGGATKSLARSVIIRDLAQPEHVVKTALESLVKQGKITSPARGYWALILDRTQQSDARALPQRQPR